MINTVYKDIFVCYLDDDIYCKNTVYFIKVESETSKYIYIGQTRVSLRDRVYQHCLEASSLNPNNFKNNVIKQTSKITVGALRKGVIDNDISIVERFFIYLFNKNTNYILLNDLKYKGSGALKTPSKQTLAVSQYTLGGDYIKTFSSTNEAANELNFSKSVIGKCCRGTYKTCYGYQFRYGDLKEKIKETYSHHKMTKKQTTKKIFDKRDAQIHRAKKILQYSLNGDFIAEHNGLREAMRNTGIDTKAIRLCCIGSYKQSNGFQFRFKNSELPIETDLISKSEETRKNNVLNKGYKVQKLNENKEIVKTYNSVNEARLDFGVSGASIHSACKNGNIFKGYYWRRL